METTLVAVRVRSIPNSKEDPVIWGLPTSQQIQLNSETHQEFLDTKRLTSKTKTAFKFDYCFNPLQDNPHIYDNVVKPLIISSLAGVNASIFMYGQAGSGKTYTMLGQTPEIPIKDYSINTRDTSAYNAHMDLTLNKEYSNEFLNIPSDHIKTPRTKADFIKRSKSMISQDLIKSVHNKAPLQQQNIMPIPGILDLSLHDLFRNIQQDLDRTYLLRVSYIEIYNENIFDLLKPREKLSETLLINEDPIKGFYIKGLVEESVGSIDEVLDKLKKGEENRHYAQTMMNHTSSRSHTVFRILIRSITNRTIRLYRRKYMSNTSNINNKKLLDSLLPSDSEDPLNFSTVLDNNRELLGEGTIITEALLNFVDLGGSEKVSNHWGEDDIMETRLRTPDRNRDKSKSPIRNEKSTKERVKEGQYINKSVFFLTQVLAFRTENQNPAHIPYRNSALTKILKTSLAGNSKILIICCVTPILSQFDQTMSTLRFGVNAKRFVITKKPEPNIEINNDEEALRLIIAEYEKKIGDLEASRTRDHEELTSLRSENQRLNEETDGLKKRLSRNNAKNALLFLKALPISYKKEFLDQIREDIAYLPTNGLVFMTQNNKKYGLIDPEKKNQSLKANWQDLIYDYEGVSALRNYRLIKEINKNLMEKFTIFKEKIEGFSYELIRNEKDETEKYRIKYQNMMRIMFNRFKIVSEEFQKVSQEYFKSLKRLDIFEKYENLSGLNEVELEKLEKHLLKGFDIVKDERFRRKYDKEYRPNNISQNTSMEKDRARKKNYEAIVKIIENFLDFDEIRVELDFDIDDDMEEPVEGKNGFKERITGLKDKFNRLAEDMLRDSTLEKNIQNLKEFDLNFHQRFELKTSLKLYEELGLYEETKIDDLLDKFIEDKEFLGENLLEKCNNQLSPQKTFQIISPLERPLCSMRELSPKKKIFAYNSYEDLLDNLNTSFKGVDLLNKDENSIEKEDDISFEARSQKVKENSRRAEGNNRYKEEEKKKENEKTKNSDKKQRIDIPKDKQEKNKSGKLSLSVSSKEIHLETADTTARNSTPHKLQNHLSNIKDFPVGNVKKEKTPKKEKLVTIKKPVLHKSKTNLVKSEKGFFEENEENHEKNQKLLNIDETKIKTEGEDTLFSASIFEDELGSAEWKNSKEEQAGWLFEDEKKGNTKRKK